MSDLYRRLQQHLDRMPVPFPATDSGVEIRILQRLFTPEEAEAALALSMIPEPAGTIRKRLPDSRTLDRLVALLDSMANKGVIERVTARGRKRYAKSILAIGIYERQLTRLTAELQSDVETYFEEAFGRAFQTATPRQIRTVPVNVEIVSDRAVASYDDIRSFVVKSAGPFAVMDCICRHGRDLLGQPCQQTSLRRTCLTFGPAAKGMVDSGAAQFIAREETLEVLSAADREGLVLQPQNTTEPLFICCCCGCCCGVLRSAKVLPEPAAFFKASYHAASDADICAGCAICESRCQMEAVHVTDGSAAVDLSRCIGCGLCVTTCSTGAMRLLPNATSAEPAKSTPALYLKMYRERFGTYEMAKALGKAIVGQQV
jgi:Na+-translocating ferredoxin:NAD+ oxidoreductase subunit B